jgi:hypothetical protein
MRSKWITSVVAVAFLFLGATGCKNLKHYDSGAYIAYPFLVSKSAAEIEQKFYECGFTSTSKQEVIAGSARFLFYTKNPYRGVPIDGVYCYEQIGVDRWILRGFFPINGLDFQGVNGKDTIEINYLIEGDSLNVVCNGTLLFSVKSVASAVQKK